MLNPYLQSNLKEKTRKDSPAPGELSAQRVARAIAASAPRSSAGLWLGRLLIRIGEKLAKDSQFNTIRENV